MLVIDELYNVLVGNSVNWCEFFNLLCFFGNELCIFLVGVGMCEVYLVICLDDQLENCFELMLLLLWEVNEDCCLLLVSFVVLFLLWWLFLIVMLDMVCYLFIWSEGIIGEFVYLLVVVVVVVVESGEEVINYCMFSMVDYIGFSEWW